MSDILATFDMTLSEPDTQVLYAVETGGAIIDGFRVHSPTGAYEPKEGYLAIGATGDGLSEAYLQLPFAFSDLRTVRRFEVHNGRKLLAGDMVIAQVNNPFMQAAGITIDVIGYALSE